jgi:hypothetical protein
MEIGAYRVSKEVRNRERRMTKRRTLITLVGREIGDAPSPRCTAITYQQFLSR